MIGVKVREEDLRQRKAHPVAHHLALGALAALEQQSLAFAHESHGGDVALDGWSRCGSAEKRDGKHGGEYRDETGRGEKGEVRDGAPRARGSPGRTSPLSLLPVQKTLTVRYLPGRSFRS